jgi:GDP-4-dehydro-6-deoxy-D-mannose reductase
MNVLITGVDGFVASHMVDYILANEKGWRIIGTMRRMADKRNIEHVLDKVEVIEMELTDYHSVENAVVKANPDRVFHLAGQTFVPTSWVSPAATFEVNAVGTVHLLEALRKHGSDARIQIASSSETYGLVKERECPIHEDKQPLRPLSPYGVSKVAADYFGWQYARSYGMKIVRTRSFNMTGPRRGEEFVDSNFAKQIALIEAGKAEGVLWYGNLAAVRDFTDVRDSVRAYWMLTQKGYDAGDVFNVCSGKGRSMKEVLYKLLDLSGIKRLGLKQDPLRMRPSDVPLLTGSANKLFKYTGWEPKIRWEQSMEDLLNYWRERVRKS